LTDSLILTSRQALIQAASTHNSNHYCNGTFTLVDTPTAFIIQFTSDTLNPSNYYNGKWMTEYTIDYDNWSVVKGCVSVGVHYYEDGNVHMNNTRTFTLPITPSTTDDASTYASTVISTILKLETTHQQSLNTIFVNLSESFKGLRRALPITRSKMDWNSINTCLFFRF